MILITSFFIAKRLKRNYTPQINLSGIALKDLNGNIVNLANFAGKPLVVNFWGSWCGPCRQELPGFEKAREKYGNQINLVMVSDEQVDKIVKFKEENNYTFFMLNRKKHFMN